MADKYRIRRLTFLLNTCWFLRDKIKNQRHAEKKYEMTWNFPMLLPVTPIRLNVWHSLENIQVLSPNNTSWNDGSRFQWQCLWISDHLNFKSQKLDFHDLLWHAKLCEQLSFAFTGRIAHCDSIQRSIDLLMRRQFNIPTSSAMEIRLILHKTIFFLISW